MGELEGQPLPENPCANDAHPVWGSASTPAHLWHPYPRPGLCIRTPDPDFDRIQTPRPLSCPALMFHVNQQTQQHRPGPHNKAAHRPGG